MTQNPNTREPTKDETKEIARKSVMAEIQGAIDFLGELRNKENDAGLKKQYGQQMSRLIDAKRWINFIAFGQVIEEKQE